MQGRKRRRESSRRHGRAARPGASPAAPSLAPSRPAEEVDTLLDAAHDAMVRSFEVPERDRYQILTEHEPSHLRALDTGLDIPRTDRFVMVEVVSRPRSRAAKLAFYKNLCCDLAERCGIEASDVMVSFTQNTDEDWSFGNGRAQFVTVKL